MDLSEFKKNMFINNLVNESKCSHAKKDLDDLKKRVVINTNSAFLSNDVGFKNHMLLENKKLLESLIDANKNLIDCITKMGLDVSVEIIKLFEGLDNEE